MTGWQLTGRTRHRAKRTLFRTLLALQVEEAGTFDRFDPLGYVDSYEVKRWRDARVSDVIDGRVQS